MTACRIKVAFVPGSYLSDASRERNASDGPGELLKDIHCVRISSALNGTACRLGAVESERRFENIVEEEMKTANVVAMESKTTMAGILVGGKLV